MWGGTLDVRSRLDDVALPMSQADWNAPLGRLGERRDRDRH